MQVEPDFARQRPSGQRQESGGATLAHRELIRDGDGPLQGGERRSATRVWLNACHWTLSRLEVRNPAVSRGAE